MVVLGGWVLLMSEVSLYEAPKLDSLNTHTRSAKRTTLIVTEAFVPDLAQAKARIWPGLSYVRLVRSTAVQRRVLWG